MKIKASELEGVVLDWATQYAVLMNRGANEPAAREAAVLWAKSGDRSYSVDWECCGPLIDEYDVWLCHEFQNDEKMYTASTHMNAVHTYDTDVFEGRTAQVAICRAIVAAKLGDEVDVPEELITPQTD